MASAAPAATPKPDAYFVLDGVCCEKHITRRSKKGQITQKRLYVNGWWKESSNLTLLKDQGPSCIEMVKGIEMVKEQKDKIRFSYLSDKNVCGYMKGVGLTIAPDQTSVPTVLRKENAANFLENKIFIYQVSKTSKSKKLETVSKQLQIMNLDKFNELVSAAQKDTCPKKPSTQKGPVAEPPSSPSSEKDDEKPIAFPRGDDPTIQTPRDPSGQIDPTKQEPTKQQAQKDPITTPPGGDKGGDQIDSDKVEGKGEPKTGEAAKSTTDSTEKSGKSGDETKSTDSVQDVPPSEKKGGIFNLIGRFVSFWLLFGWLSWLFSSSDSKPAAAEA